MREVVAVGPAATRLFTQILSFVSDPERMRDFITNPDNLQMITTMGLGQWAAINSMKHDYNPSQVATILNAPGYAIPGSGPTNIAEGGFDLEGEAYTPSMPPNNPAARFRSTAPPAFVPNVNASNKNLRIAQMLQNELQSDDDYIPKQNDKAQEKVSYAPMPSWSMQDLFNKLQAFEKYNQNKSDAEKIQGYKVIISEYDNTLSDLRKWLEENGIQKTELNRLVNETRTNK